MVVGGEEESELPGASEVFVQAARVSTALGCKVADDSQISENASAR